MGDRLTRITTRSGDKGKSGLADGSRHAKTSPHFRALGDIDELNCMIGVVLTGLAPDHVLHDELIEIQSRLFDLGGAIALPRSEHSMQADTQRLDQLVTEHTQRLGSLENFILPGGSVAGAHMHLARAICRRAERSLWELCAISPNDYDQSLAIYLNRLSDALFVFARLLNESTPERLWQQNHI